MTETLEAKSHPLLDENFEAEADRLTGTVIREGNTATLMPSGAQSYVRRWELVDKAQHSLDLVSFSVMNDGTTKRLREVLSQKVRQGVIVRMVVDDAAVYSASSGGILSDLAKAGGRTHTLQQDLSRLVTGSAQRESLPSTHEQRQEQTEEALP